MSGSYDQCRSREALRTVPVSSGAALIATRLGNRRQDLAEESPEAVVWSGVFLDALHQYLYGQAAALSGDRTPRYRRAQVDGTKSLPVEDLVYMAMSAPDLVAPALEVLLVLCGRTSVAMSADAPPVCEANGLVFRAFGSFEAGLAEALADGTISDEEASGLLQLLVPLVDRLESLRSALANGAKR